jgi:hypothetical protein
MIEIMSYGNQLCTGEYKIHSRFNSAVNFISGDTFVFVVNESVGAGPVNIVVNGIVPQSVDFLKIEDTCFKINGAEFGFESGKRYDPFININDFAYERVVKNLEIVERGVIEKGSQQSLSYLLLHEEKQPPFPPLLRGTKTTKSFGIRENEKSFEEECRRIFRAGADQVLYGDVLTGVKMLKGLGPGLTPSGDDFNSGLLIAMNVIKQIYELEIVPGNREEWIPAFAGMTIRDLGMTDMVESTTPRLRRPPLLRGIIESVYEAARGKNPFTNSFLLCASKGQLFFKFRELINAVLNSEYNKIIKNTELVLTMGETSGADQLTGFLIGMKRFLK